MWISVLFKILLVLYSNVFLFQKMCSCDLYCGLCLEVVYCMVVFCLSPYLIPPKYKSFSEISWFIFGNEVVCINSTRICPLGSEAIERDQERLLVQARSCFSESLTDCLLVGGPLRCLHEGNGHPGHRTLSFYAS